MINRQRKSVNYTRLSNIDIFRDVMTYAWRGSGRFVLMSCVIISIISDLIFSFSGILGAMGFLFIAGYFCATFYQMTLSSAVGGVEAPDFPETSNLLEDIIFPYVQIVVIAVFSFIPLIVYVECEGFQNLFLCGIFYLLGVIYFPMALLAVIILGYTGAMSPHIIFRSIYRAGWIYWVAVALLLLINVLGVFFKIALSDFVIVGNIILAITGSYILMTNARILGIIYRERKYELSWLE